MNDFFIKQLRQLKVSKKSRILLAVSGGIDSMVLLNLLKTNGYNFAIAHCNFSLRREDSILDQKLVKKISQSHGVKLFIKEFNTVEYSEVNKISIQMAARELRYKWFESLSNKYEFRFIAIAHHKNDSVETLLINLIRGTGLSGLHGINQLDDKIIRPLLNFNKNEIIDYAKKNNIDYRDDVSNKDDKYVRSKIRNRLIPIIQEINPDIINSINKTILRVRDVEVIYDEVIREKKEKLIVFKNKEYRVNIDSLLQESTPKQLLYEIISDFNFLDVESVFTSLKSSSGKEFINSDYYMVKDRHELIISKHIHNDNVVIYKDITNIKSPFNISFSVIPYIDCDYHKNNINKMYIDFDKLEFPLLIRSWKKGDKFIPLGMKGFKKLSDYFIDNKFSLIQKKKTRLLISNNEIVCIIGERIDDRFKLVENSKKVYIVHF